MDDSSGTSEKELSRSFFAGLVDKAETEDDVADLITLFGTLNVEELEIALPSFCLLAEKCPPSLRENFMNLAYCSLADSNCSRSGRKAVFACLRVLTRGDENIWSSFFTLSQCLEEPQFHIINPVLPRMDEVLSSVYNGSLSFKWASLIFMRAFAHSNGWVRLWALEKLVCVDPSIMAGNQDFLLAAISEHLNSNDPFWRLPERNNLHSFKTSLKHLFEGILSTQDDAGRGSFVRGIFTAILKISNPSSLFFLSESLMSIQPFPCLHTGDFNTIATLLRKTQQIQHTTLRAVTQFNFVVFFCKMLKQTREASNKIGCLSAFFSRDFPQLFDLFVHVDSVEKLLLAGDNILDSVRLVLLNSCDFERDDFAALLWIRAELSDQKDQLLRGLELELADRLTALEEGVDVGLSPDVVDAVDTLLCILLASSEELSLMDCNLIQLISGYVLLRIAIASGSHAFVVHNVYMGLIRRLKCYMKPFAELALSLISEEVIPCDRHSLLIRVLYDSLDELDCEDSEEMFPKIVAYLGENPLSPIRVKKGVGCTLENDSNKIMSVIQEYRLKLLARYLPSICNDPESLLMECIEQISCSSAYLVAQCYLLISRDLVEKVTRPEILLALVKASLSVANEERKSQNFLPALQHTLGIFFSKSVMSNVDTRSFVMSTCTELLELARLNTPVALYLAKVLVESEQKNLLNFEWATLILSLAVFGPIPKKESRVVNAAYDEIYNFIPSEFDDIHKPFEVVQRTRLNSICVALQFSRKSPLFANHLVDIILTEINSMNQSSSRSFGLSFAHRQNTRAVSLLLLIVDHVSEEAILDKVFTNCVDWITDPCQQFSIKLILEWLLARIGSVSSWINMIVLMARADADKTSIPQFVELILPWTTAQNFAVRCTAIAAIRLLYDAMNSEDKERCHLIAKIVKFDGEPSGNSQRIIDNLDADFYFGHLHPVKHFDMQTIFVVLPSKTGMPPEELIPNELLQRFNTCSIRSTCEDKQFLDAPSVVYSGLSKSSSCAPEINEDEVADDGINEGGGAPLVQRKIVTKQRCTRDDCSLIVVASLVDKPNNLGGLCRTCEIFGVNTLVIADLVFASDPGFKALSMSAEKKQKMEAVRPEALLAYLENMRKNGYAVIAAEQTTDSVSLHKFKFPKKTVLLLGDEKEGVPVQLLRCVDQTVEIEQLGQTRSLNVHVSAALFIAKYVEQILLS
ncbi:hypothetical protein RB195_016632 [Necator americanus]|uniref:tRNA/rRNA methyltransferase SpoU type domain-containing protein n=1 Tax=Necator americanus TaxID=51031 RepID=A0ABR1C1D4_NECAM